MFETIKEIHEDSKSALFEEAVTPLIESVTADSWSDAMSADALLEELGING